MNEALREPGHGFEVAIATSRAPPVPGRHPPPDPGRQAEAVATAETTPVHPAPLRGRAPVHLSLSDPAAVHSRVPPRPDEGFHALPCRPGGGARGAVRSPPVYSAPAATARLRSAGSTVMLYRYAAPPRARAGGGWSRPRGGAAYVTAPRPYGARHTAPDFTKAA
jgi:hypothetical protein